MPPSIACKSGNNVTHQDDAPEEGVWGAASSRMRHRTVATADGPNPWPAATAPQ
eukprot:CAMPEP_0172539924 /NCGR_PEP_ID=MMETSP1067-20121228/11033_1 /TAXON_ID=265564 ORGANISM="Thalassiosira punctigera, Strain Tpunct2005C2" /NCGR_SAMPLE_ID=MMETSP1067 /ASSEMBLY_ACC=CAM_ASM_000444 /LENGTH=53 /DNA_ID=CAMNT_0013325681 /DNA_START=41 /DNA_END=199 /DNA_ORIENTATION=+